MEKPEIKAVIGLGNPGKKYEKHRHNIGFRVVDALGERFSASWSSSELMEYAEVFSGSGKLWLIKSNTFMNTSGKVIPFLTKKGIKPEEILVVHDELEKKFGAISMKVGGSARGHNGLRSIIGVIGKDFWRLRFGIDRPENREDVGDYVLSNFHPDEEAQIPELIEKAIDAIQVDLLAENI